MTPNIQSSVASMTHNIKTKAGKRIKELGLGYFNLAITRVDREGQEKNLRSFFHKVAPVSTNHRMIRLGAHNDGGYLLPDDLLGTQTCFSPGVSTLADFEFDLTRRNIKCYLADYSVESAPIQSPLISFEKRYLGNKNDSIYITLPSWVSSHAEPTDNNLILQMDIEGAEYDVLIETPVEVLERFRIIVIEFHYLDALFNPFGFKLVSGVFERLLRSFKCVHIHPNNFCDPIRYGEFAVFPVMEFTFHRIDRISHFAAAGSFPHQLDEPNCPWRPDVPLPNCWHPGA
jgi:methyltransferase FkbM-like protein